MPAEELSANHFYADEAEQGAEAVVQEPEAVGYIAEQEEEASEAHDGKYVGCVDNHRVLGDGEDCGDRVDCKDDVAEFDDEQYKEEGCHFAGMEKVVSVTFACYGEVFGCEAYDWMVGCVDWFVSFVAEHFHAAVYQNDSEDGE